jgi:hypothetical protein
MLKLKLNNMFLGMTFLSVLVPFQVMSMSVEESVVAKLLADVSLRAERTAKKQQGGYNDTVYNSEFSVLPDKAMKTTGKFKAFGLAAILYEERSVIKRVGAMDVEFYPGLDIFGNVIDPVQWSCSTPKCGDVKCAPSFISAVRLKKMTLKK